MRAAFEEPGMVRYVVVLLVGLPVAMIVSGMHPDRQGAGFVPFMITLVAALAVVWLIGYVVERLWLARVSAGSESRRRRR